MYSEAISNALTQLQGFSLTDAQIASYGKWFLAASAACYVATTLRVNKVMSLTSNSNASSGGLSYEEDMQHAISVHLPQGFDRSVIDSRLQQRHNKELMQRILLLNDVKSVVRNATSRAEKLQGWNELFRTTLVGLVAASYAHSLTLNLFAMKNTVRVLVFVLRQRSDQCRLEEKQKTREQRHRRVKHKKKSNANNDDGLINTEDNMNYNQENERNEEEEVEEYKSTGALDKVRTWWSVGTRSMVTGMLLEQMTRKMAAEQQRQQFLQRSPFTFLGVGEEVPLPLPPCNTLTEEHQQQEQHVHSADNHNHDGSVDDDSETRSSGVVQNGNGQSNNSNNNYKAHINKKPNHNNYYHHVHAEHNFSVRVIMEAAIPLIIQTAERVVANALMTLQSNKEPLSLPEPEKEIISPAVVVQKSSDAAINHKNSNDKNKQRIMYDAAGNVSSTELWQLLHLIATEMEHTVSITAWIQASSYNSTNLHEVNQEAHTMLQEKRLQQEEHYKNTNGSESVMSSNESKKVHGDDDDIIDYPARSTVKLGANGKPIPHVYDSTSQELHGSTFKYEKNSECDTTCNHKIITENEDELHDAEYAELRQDENTQRQHVKYFQELIHSVSFAELCCTHAAELLEEQLVEIVQNMKTVKTYDATNDRAKMLLVMTSLEKYRQHAFDAEFTVPRYVTLFAQELIRSTCSQ